MKSSLKRSVSTPEGTRDFSADVMHKRNYIFKVIKTVFENYGFEQLETPAMENLSTLTGKYGEEGDKLIFKIRSNRNLFETYADLEKLKPELLAITNHPYTFLPHASERALRYDLTIPFARYVAMNFGQLTFPFKRYQIQPVWRADRPQRGRYREFYQCDADVVGSKSLLNEAELTCLYAEVFARLNIDVQIKINSRKILVALAEICGGSDKLTDITVAIDKLDKIGIDKVKEELSQRGLYEEQISIIEQYLSIDGNNENRLEQVKKLFQNTETGRQGIADIEYIISFLPSSVNYQLLTDFTLARGLSYYTGIIFEVKANGVQMGSIGGGGRYDDLTGLFGVPNVPGVGISFGVDRIYDVMEELKLFPEELVTGTKVLFFNLGEAESKAAFGLMQQLRSKNIGCEIYGEVAKFDKQFKYAEKKNIPYIVIIGSEEMGNGTFKIKNLSTGQQETTVQEELLHFPFE